MDLNRFPRATNMLSMNLIIFVVFGASMSSAASAQSDSLQKAPWRNVALSPDQRAALLIKEMTIDEKISLLHGTGLKDLSPVSPLAVGTNGGAGYVVGIPRLGIRRSRCRMRLTACGTAGRMAATRRHCRRMWRRRRVGMWSPLSSMAL